MKMTTASGRYIDLSDIGTSFSEASITKGDLVEEISRGLANTLRFSGQLGNLTVAQHSLLVARIAKHRKQSSRQQLIGLLHDASEAYLGDIPTPLKMLLPDYRALEARVMEAIYTRFLDVWFLLDGEKKLLDAADVAAFELEVTLHSPFPFPCYGMEFGIHVPAEFKTEEVLWSREEADEAFNEALWGFVR
jgi:hypothetical protein